jgi:gliding motility-associated-like protein
MTITFTKNDLMCHDVNTGNIDITVTGGTGLFTYLWHDGYTLEDRTQLSAGAYSVTVNDDVNCSVSANIIITQPDTLIVSETHTDIRCAGETTGEILITVTGGVAPYQYYWNDGVTIQNRSGLAYGFYTVTVQDNNFCTAILGVNLTEPPPIEVIHTHTDAGCNGTSNGRIEITTGGGVPPYSYTWNDGATTEDRSNLAAGNYSVTVTDNNQCTVTVSEVISELSSFIVDIFPTPESCAGKQDGRVNVQHTGGTSPFSYSWSNGLTTRDIDNLSAGTYFLTITDANNCALIESAVVEALSSLTVNAVLKNATCPPMTDGEITLSVSGGSGSITYTWNDGNTESKNENLAPGNYSVTITDGNGCTVSDSFSITYDYIFSIEVEALGADTIMKGESVTLNVLTNGNIVNFEWQPAFGLDCNTCASPLASPLATTNYVVNAISLNGCMASDSVRIVVIERENVFAPGGFSPNGDGINDEFALNGAIVDVEKFYIMVYDRWGEKLFESYDPDFRWSGIFKGKPLPPGVYVYHMKYKLKGTDTLFERKGSVTLIR